WLSPAPTGPVAQIGALRARARAAPTRAVVPGSSGKHDRRLVGLRDETVANGALRVPRSGGAAAAAVEPAGHPDCDRRRPHRRNARGVGWNHGGGECVAASLAQLGNGRETAGATRTGAGPGRSGPRRDPGAGGAIARRTPGRRSGRVGAGRSAGSGAGAAVVPGPDGAGSEAATCPLPPRPGKPSPAAS